MPNCTLTQKLYFVVAKSYSYLTLVMQINALIMYQMYNSTINEPMAKAEN